MTKDKAKLKSPGQPPKISLPDGWVWVWREVPKRWMATGAIGSFWCDSAGCWEDCTDYIPIAVVIAVLHVNGAL